MFAVANNTVLAPVTVPVFSVPAAGVNVTTYLADFKCSDGQTVATVGAIINVLALKAQEGAASPLKTSCLNMFTTGAAQAYSALISAAIGNGVDDNAANVRAIRANIAAAPSWINNLVNAAKKKPITEGNVEGFFAMLGHSGTKASAVAFVINRIAVFFPDQINDANFRASLVAGVWTTYRITRYSAGTILVKLLDDFVALGILTAASPQYAAIVAAGDNPHSHVHASAIHDKYKAYGAIFLQAAGTPIDNWIQGNKAIDALPSAKVRGAKEIFRRYLEVKNNTTAVNSITSVAGFTAMGTFF
jgi:hypothetical protein